MSTSSNDLNINWFPGHMAKAIKNIKEKLKFCDGVIQIADARAPDSSFVKYLDQIIENKIKVIVLSKSDLADTTKLNKYINKMKEKNVYVFASDLRNNSACKQLLTYLESIQTPNDIKYIQKGFPQPIKRFMVLGIPNVGKSTFINSLSKKKKAAVENIPGKTRSETLIHVSDKVYIYDSPGILEPNYEDKNIITKLALLGCVKQNVLPIIDLCNYLLTFLKANYPENLISRYKVDNNLSNEEIVESIAKNRNFLLQSNTLDCQRARLLLLNEFKSGMLGRISLDE